jgi:formyl-CoA transferase
MTEPLLQGIRVVEAAMVMMAPSVGSILADMGAEVIKVEPPDGGDTLRQFHKLKGMPESDIPYPFLQLNRNKKSVAVDLKTDEGIEIFHKLLETADVFISNVRPQALMKLGLDYESLKDTYPKLVHATGLGFGEEGPDAHRPGYDATTYWARSGMESTVFPLEGWLGPTPPGSGDLPTGLALFGGIMTALFNRERTGKGTNVTVSLMATGAWANSALVQAQLVNAEFLERRPRENAYNFIGVYYKTSD